jgi:hypothetical protein
MSARRLATVLVASAVALAIYALARPAVRKSYGSPTNASDAVDAPEIKPGATPDEVLDVGVEYTFPASDPIAVETAYRRR